jgi:hypothetical protein
MSGQAIFDLLPAVYRLRDAQVAQSLNLQTGPLQSLLMLVDEQLEIMAEDLNQGYDDLFIETCAEWIIPYIGDLIGYQLVNGVAPAVASPRAEVANTISFRDRKGAVLVLEQLARDVTGWGAHAVEFFKKLAGAQYLNHLRPYNHYTPDLRSWRKRTHADTAFDETAHMVDVRSIASGRGRYGVQNIGVFLWSLTAYGLQKIPATAVDASGQFFRISPLGVDMPLFNTPISQGSDITSPAQPVNVPDRLLRLVLSQDIQAGVGSVYYGEGASLALYLSAPSDDADNPAFLYPYQVQVCDLSGPDGNWSNTPASGIPNKACIDPELGRIFCLNGVLIVYSLQADATIPRALLHASTGGATEPSTLTLRDCTLVPGLALTPAGQPRNAYVGQPTLLVDQAGWQVTIQRSRWRIVDIRGSHGRPFRQHPGRRRPDRGRLCRRRRNKRRGEPHTAGLHGHRKDSCDPVNFDLRQHRLGLVGAKRRGRGALVRSDPAGLRSLQLSAGLFRDAQPV